MKLILQTGDCLDLLAKLKSQSVDVVVTSPPYNLNIKYDKYHDNASTEHYMQFMQQVATQIFRVLKSDGSFFINIGGTNANPYLPLTLPILLAQQFVLQNNIVWAKSIAIDGKTVGHYKPINSKRYLNHCFEHIFHFTKTGKVALDRLSVGVAYSDKSNITRRGHKQDLKCAGDIWFIRYQTKTSKKETFWHPASYPVELPERCIKLHGKKHPIVLDPFLGIGSSGIAAINCQAKKFIGFDISKKYITISKNRIEELL